MKKSKSDLGSTCKWCSKEFRSERTLASHMCVKKRRWTDRSMSHVRLGFRAFQMFYEMNTASTTPKSEEDFIHSQYYAAFVKFGRACSVNEYLDPQKYTEYLIKNGVKLKDWPSDRVYSEYIKDYVRKETGLRALERTVLSMDKWAKEEDGRYLQDYFTKATINRIVYDIRAAKVSPWVLYLCETGGNALENFNDEQAKLVKEFIDADFWLKVFQKNPEEVDEVRSACEAAGI